MKSLLSIMCLVALTGCSTVRDIGVGSPVVDVPVFVAEGHSLERAIVSAAQRRRWLPKKTDEKTYRLTIVQRKNRCVVDVVMNGNKSFSILPVESNISVRKYDQWVQNLWREIVHRADRGR
jgi:hypothetical protein